MNLVDFIKDKRKLRKILIAGSGAVGKTSLVKVLKTDASCLDDLEDEDLEYHRTLFMELEKIDAYEGTEGVFQFYDVAGQLTLPIHAFRDTTRLAFGNVDIVILMFSSDNLQTLLDIKQWFEMVTDYYDNNDTKNPSKLPTIVLVKNKIDLDCVYDDNLVEGIKKQEQVEEYFEISCLTGEGIDTLFQWVSKYCFD